MQQAQTHSVEAVRLRSTVSALLRHDIDEFVDELRKTNRLLHRARAGQLSHRAFGRYLRSIHYLLRHTSIHLSVAEDHARRLGYLELARFFAHKRAEETGHDRWAEADIERFATTFSVRIPDDPLPTMKAIVDANTDGIERDPFYYVAYAFFAEYFMIATGSEWLCALAEGCGIHESLVTAIAKHVELDKGHVAEACAEIDALVGLEREESLRRALQGMMRRLGGFSDELCDTDCG